VYEGLVWTEAEAEDAIAHDILKAQLMCANLPEIKGLDQCRADAVTELVFNMGLRRWMGFEKCREALEANAWKRAHDELEDSLWYTQVGPTRGDRLCDALLTGVCDDA
jgi:GH24 family phage-related lysozyme (muramidase)